MKRRKVCEWALASLLVLSFLSALPARAAEEKTPARTNPAFVQVADDPALPRVLLIGDSISMGYTLPVRAALRGKANVHRPPTNCGNSENGLKNLEAWLGRGRWDVIHFNFGLHDLKTVDGKAFITVADYEKNLRAIVKRLQKTGAALIWCSTTPVPGKTTKPDRDNENVIAYNAAAKKVMEENGIAIDDLYEFAAPQLEKIQRPANVHFTEKGSKVLAQQVSKEILKAMKK